MTVKQKRFTLIELLTVVAILLILVAMLLPSLESARERGRVIVCVANMKSIHTATMVYTSSNERYTPDAFAWVTTQPGTTGYWRDAWRVSDGVLFDYISGEEGAYVCPSAEHWFPKATANQTPPAFTYSMNAYFSYAHNWLGFPGIRRVSQVDSPSTLMMYGEENAWAYPGYAAYPINNGAIGVGAWPSGIVDGLASFHLTNYDNWRYGGQGAVAFVDGHVALHHVSESVELGTPIDAR